MKVIIATRESPLALEQAQLVKDALLQCHPSLRIEFLGITTQADKQLEVSLRKIGGKGLFVKELETALLQGQADIAVHSMKDVPMELPPGLCIPTVTKREDARDVFVSNRYQTIFDLPTGAPVGTSSLRRQLQLQKLRPDLVFSDLRGNIQTRLKRLDENDFDAIILASAGLKRMGLTARIASYLSIDECLPAAGQGVLGIECREDNSIIRELLQPLNDSAAMTCLQAERAACQTLGGGCYAPVAAYATLREVLTLTVLVAGKQGEILKTTLKAEPAEAQALGKLAAEELIQQGAKTLLDAFKHD